MTGPFTTHWPALIGKASLAAWKAKIHGLYVGILLLKERGQWNLSRQLALLVTQSSAERTLSPNGIIDLLSRHAFSVCVCIYIYILVSFEMKE